MSDNLRRFTQEELSAFNGQDGKPVYVAYEGNVYDVTESKLWKTGTHMKRHASGIDLTGEIDNAPHDTSVLERFPQVGVLTDAAAPVETGPDFSHLPGPIAKFLTRFPFFERHPHPLTVHFPIALDVVAPLFLILYLITRVRGFEVTGFYVLGAADLFALAAIPTGFLTWWVNYLAKPVKVVTIKITLSFVLLAIGLVAFFIRLGHPDLLNTFSGPGVIYFVLVCALLPVVLVIGALGATLTFPLPKRHKKEKTEA